MTVRELIEKLSKMDPNKHIDLVCVESSFVGLAVAEEDGERVVLTDDDWS